ncbi:valine--tRNA ligase [Candidatus Saccharibacteria bacterium]|jgi:valine--tRNA ligase|nr:valine--tRNA ligase [Candidatus Saccharibacteria bacterium]
MSLAKTYTPNEYEPSIYALWEESGVFKPKGQGQPYAIVMPPPNANGNLHVGHALGSAIQDILVRYHRMQGYDAVYIPGADHAGFETWVVYERELEKHGQTRFDFNREELYAQVWDFVAKRRGDMELQLRAIGVGADWDDLVFTLDDKVIKTVYDTFEKMWQDGYIYRGERIVNYCTQHQTSFSDYEVVHKNEKGKLWEIAYPLIDKVGEIVIATTRPETMFGDVAVAVNPNDERYKDLVGCKALLPIVKREIPIIADDYVDPAYGTGMVKITPAHDPNDFEVGKRHNLELVQVIDFDGKMINVPGQFVGMTALEARKRVLAALEIDELLRGEKDIEHQVGHCYKCGSVIEPLAKEQWFVKMRQLADNAIAAIERKEVTFTPENKGDVVIKYLKDIKDWNISRQIPWGIPIPMFQSKTNLDDWRYSTEVDKKEIVVDGTTYRREEDTLDTWFSSGQWPYITTDYLDTGKLAKYYPNTVMETAGDILFAWVARMIMLGLYRTGQVPFKHVYLHGLVLDEKGIKMSKSKGNVINPMETVAKYGSDALRMGIIASRSAAQPQAFNTGKVVAARNFCNKLWNIARYTENLVGDRTPAVSPQLQSLADHWIARQLDEAAQSLDRQIATYHFAEAGETIYHTVWDDVADWYIEASKVEQNIDMNAYVLDTILRLTHPFAPFLTETIWQALPWHDTILASETMPDHLEYDDIAAAAFGRLKDLVSEARYVVSELPGNKRYGLLYMDDSLVADNIELVKKLARVTSVEYVDQARGLRLAASGRDVWLDIDDETLYEHQANLEKRLAEERQHIRTLETRLANDNYVAKAPPALVEESRKTLREKQELITRLQNELQVVSNK